MAQGKRGTSMETNADSFSPPGVTAHGDVNPRILAIWQ
jgi:hypothetical protein